MLCSYSSSGCIEMGRIVQMIILILWINLEIDKNKFSNNWFEIYLAGK